MQEGIEDVASKLVSAGGRAALGVWLQAEAATRTKLGNLVLESSVEPCLRDGLIDFRFRAAGRDPADRFAIDLDRQPTLVWKEVGEGQRLDTSLFHVVRSIL